MVQTFIIMNKAEIRSGQFIHFFNIIQKYIIMKKIKSKIKKYNYLYYKNIIIILKKNLIYRRREYERYISRSQVVL